VADVQAERTFELAGLSDPLALCGEHDCNLAALEAIVPVTIHVDGERIRLRGDAAAVDSAHAILGRMFDAAVAGVQMTPDDVALAARDALFESEGAPRELPKTLFTATRGREIRAKTEGQRTFVDAMLTHPLTFAIGPAGTGKTFLAMTMAVRALRAREISRIVLTRPAVEAGEKLGFLPGDLKEKVDPYLRPLYDALSELLDDAAVARALERGVVEVAPLAYMRGRTLNDAYIILDEAQNATREQLKMFLTRLGQNSKMVVNGDITQIDLPPHVFPGLLDARRLFGDIDDIAIVDLTERDSVRNPLVAKIIGAYARAT
jgi:phosphate starvation-inducible PhoH-like protein